MIKLPGMSALGQERSFPPSRSDAIGLGCNVRFAPIADIQAWSYAQPRPESHTAGWAFWHLKRSLSGRFLRRQDNSGAHAAGHRQEIMKKIILAIAAVTALAGIATSANAQDRVVTGAAIGAGTGLVVAGPPGAVVGGVIGAV